MPVSEAMAKTTATQFLRWQVFWNQEKNTHDPLHYYLAKIIREIRASRPVVRSAQELNARQDILRTGLEDFLVKFVTRTQGTLSDADAKAKMSASKSFWTFLTGVGPGVKSNGHSQPGEHRRPRQR